MPVFQPVPVTRIPGVTASLVVRRFVWFWPLAILALTSEGLLAQPRSPSEGPWSGQAQCVVVAKYADYLDEQTHTWTITGAPPAPTPRGSAQIYFTWPATWTVKGGGQRTLPSSATVRAQTERWTIANEMTIAIRITEVVGGTVRLRFNAEGLRGAPLGSLRVTDASGRTRDGAVQPWPFPAIEDSTTNTTISGSSTRTYPEGYTAGWSQPRQAMTTATCTWSFTRGGVDQISTNTPARGRGEVPRGIQPAPASPPSPASAPPATQSPAAAASAGSATRPDGSSSIGEMPTTGATVTTVLAGPPGGPPVFGLRAHSTPTSISLRWVCPAGASGYEVSGAPAGQPPVKLTSSPLTAPCLPDAEVSPTIVSKPGVPAATFDKTYSTTFTHSGLPTAREYSYVVRALYPTGGPADALPFAARTSGYPAPAGASAATGVAGQVHLQWERVSTLTSGEATAYVVSRKLAGETAFRTVATVPAAISYTQRYSDGGVPAGRHEYTVHALEGEPTAVLMVVAGVPDLSQVSLLQLAEVSLGWTVWPGTPVRLMTAPLAAGPWTDFAASLPASATSLRFIATPGTRTYYKVVATYPTITLESTAKVLDIPQWPGLTDFKATTNGNIVDLSWKCDPGVVEYRVTRVWNGGQRYTHIPINVYPGICNLSDRGIPLEIGSANVEYVVVGFDSNYNAVRAARVKP
jgi:hypothetical protein